MNKLERSSLYQLTMVRFKLILREPEAIFWIFIFPILLAVGLGIAFRNRPADVLPRRGVRNRTWHVRDAVMDHAIDHKTRVGVRSGPSGFHTAALVDCHVDDHGTLFHLGHHGAGNEFGSG